MGDYTHGPSKHIPGKPAARDPGDTRGGGATSSSVQPPPGYLLNGRIMLAAILVLFTSMFLILLVHLYLRRRIYRRRRSASLLTSRLVFSGEGDRISGGLDPIVIESLPVIAFSSPAGEEASPLPGCAVCITEFEEGEKIRLLPRCGHRFHIECIGMWLCSHSTCPLCRTVVDSAAAPDQQPPPPPAAAPDLEEARSVELERFRRVLSVGKEERDLESQNGGDEATSRDRKQQPLDLV